jgi:hypothetical protein
MTRTAQKTMPPTILRYRGNVFTSAQTQRYVSPVILLLLQVIFDVGMYSPSRSLATKGWTHT